MAFDILFCGHPDMPAAHIADQSFSRGDLRVASQRAATLLHELGLRRGDTIAVWMPDGVVWLQLLFAAAQLGVLMVPVSTRLKLQEAQHVVATAKARLIVVPTRFLDFDYASAARQIQVNIGSVEHVLEAPVDTGFHWTDRAPYAHQEGLSSDPLCTFSTSGTTGKPKLAVHTAGGLAIHARNAGRVNDITAGDVMLCALPLYGVLGFVQAIAALASGAACVFLPVFDTERAATAFARHGVTHFFGSDAMFDMVLSAPGASLKTWRRGAFAEFAGLGQRVVERAWNEWGVRVGGLYGMSECLAMTAIRDLDGDLERRRIPGGTPVSAEIGFRIADPKTGVALPDGEHGELQLRGYNVMLGYLNNPTATVEAFTADRWFRTGDLAYAEGRTFCYLARIKDSLRLRGYLVDPTEVEDYLVQHPAVVAAQVVGVHRDGEGDVAVAFVRMAKTAATESELIAFCKAGIAGFKVPRRIVQIEAFPQVNGPNGVKILKNVLRDLAIEHLPPA